jgi:HAD superfamily hydrolase (TIGR01490 family)
LPNVAAFFDVDGTITRTLLLEPLIWYQRAHLPWPRYVAWLAGLALNVPRYLAIDRRSRSEFNAVFYRRYAGLPKAEVERFHRDHFHQTLERRVFPRAHACIREHQALGRRIVLVTGGLNLVMQPLAQWLGADHLFAMELVVKDGVFTGEMARAPVADDEKGLLIRAYASQHDVDLSQSFAYGNSLGDAAMMAEVGHPVAINASRRLRRHARQLGWASARWGRSLAS